MYLKNPFVQTNVFMTQIFRGEIKGIQSLAALSYNKITIKDVQLPLCLPQHACNVPCWIIIKTNFVEIMTQNQHCYNYFPFSNMFGEFLDGGNRISHPEWNSDPCFRLMKLLYVTSAFNSFCHERVYISYLIANCHIVF